MAAIRAGSTSGCSVDVILKTTASEYWSYVKAGAEAYSKDNPDVKVEVKGATSETAYDEQQNMIETDLTPVHTMHSLSLRCRLTSLRP